MCHAFQILKWLYIKKYFIAIKMKTWNLCLWNHLHQSGHVQRLSILFNYMVSQCPFQVFSWTMCLINNFTNDSTQFQPYLSTWVSLHRLFNYTVLKTRILLILKWPDLWHLISWKGMPFHIYITYRQLHFKTEKIGRGTFPVPWITRLGMISMSLLVWHLWICFIVRRIFGGWKAQGKG